MFAWNHKRNLRGVGGNELSPVGICYASVLLGDNKVVAEFTVLADCAHHVILGLDFLCGCGSKIECANGEISINPSIMSIFIESTADDNCHLLVS